MKVSEDIKKIEIKEELRVCPSCGYERGSHSSFLRSSHGHNIVLICPRLWREIRYRMEARRLDTHTTGPNRADLYANALKPARDALGDKF